MSESLPAIISYRVTGRYYSRSRPDQSSDDYVIMEVICTSIEEAREVYDERRNVYRNLKIFDSSNNEVHYV